MNFRENRGKWGGIFQLKMKEDEQPHSVRGRQAKSLVRADDS